MSYQEEVADIVFTKREAGDPTTYPEYNNVIYLEGGEGDVE